MFAARFCSHDLICSHPETTGEHRGPSHSHYLDYRHGQSVFLYACLPRSHICHSSLYLLARVRHCGQSIFPCLVGHVYLAQIRFGNHHSVVDVVDLAIAVCCVIETSAVAKQSGGIYVGPTGPSGVDENGAMIWIRSLGAREFVNGVETTRPWAP